MLKNTISSFSGAYKYILKDKINFILALIPILIGIIIYYFLGKTLFVNFMEWGQKYIQQYLSEGALGQIVYYIVASILTIMLYFVVNWTFVLVISIIASPFNDLLSRRIEKIHLNEDLPSFNDSFSDSISKIIPTIFNEIKKVGFIISLSLVSLLLGYIPILTPLSIFITACLLSIEFLDYSWSRHDMKFGECRKNLRQNMFSYSIGGAFFMLIIAVPVINLIVPSFATSYFTLLWVKNNESRS